jgi:hypothetical protein
MLSNKEKKRKNTKPILEDRASQVFSVVHPCAFYFPSTACCQRGCRVSIEAEHFQSFKTELGMWERRSAKLKVRPSASVARDEDCLPKNSNTHVHEQLQDDEGKIEGILLSSF